MSNQKKLINILHRLVRIILSVLATVVGIGHTVTVLTYDSNNPDLGAPPKRSMLILLLAFLFAYLIWPPKKFINQATDDIKDE